MYTKYLKSKIHRAVTTRADIHYEGSIAIDEDILDKASISSYEAVHVWNVTNGARLQTYAIAAPRGSREFCINGAAARLAQTGDILIIAAFAWLDEAEAKKHVPIVLLMDRDNSATEKKLSTP